MSESKRFMCTVVVAIAMIGLVSAMPVEAQPKGAHTTNLFVGVSLQPLIQGAVCIEGIDGLPDGGCVDLGSDGASVTASLINASGKTAIATVFAGPGSCATPSNPSASGTVVSITATTTGSTLVIAVNDTPVQSVPLPQGKTVTACVADS